MYPYVKICNRQQLKDRDQMKGKIGYDFGLGKLLESVNIYKVLFEFSMICSILFES